MNIEKLNQLVPRTVLQQIPQTMSQFQINDPLRLAHFLAQCAHESAGFKAVRENLNYSAEALQRVFRRYFPDAAAAAKYARQPERIANVVYASRMGNGAESSGDGWRYRGRGYIQLTGKNNYEAFSRAVPEDIVADPDLVATKYPLLSAAWFWNSRNLNNVADRGFSDSVVEQVTRVVNGGRHGIEDRIARFKRFHQLLGS